MVAGGSPNPDCRLEWGRTGDPPKAYQLIIWVGENNFPLVLEYDGGGSHRNISDEVDGDMDYPLYSNQLPLVEYLNTTFPSEFYKFVSLVGYNQLTSCRRLWFSGPIVTFDGD